MKPNFYSRAAKKLFDAVALTPAIIAAFYASMTLPATASSRMPHTRTRVIMPWNLKETLGEAGVVLAISQTNEQGCTLMVNTLEPGTLDALLTGKSKSASPVTATVQAESQQGWKGAPRPGYPTNRSARPGGLDA